MIRLASILAPQALSDLNRFEDSTKQLFVCLEDFRAAGHHLLTTTVLFELVHLFLKQGEKKQAEHFYNQILELYPKGYLPSRYIPCYRPVSFYDIIVRVFDPGSLETIGWVNPEFACLRIETFGRLRVHVDEYPVHDSMWQGNRTKLLLKALIVYGGTDVPADILSRLLWPDADEDAARGNLKVTLSRLKRIVTGSEKKQFSWIEMKNRRISLSKAHCYVDAIRFEELISEASGETTDINLLTKALDLYTEDFLVRDINEEWILSHKLHLRDLLIKGVRALHDQCQKEDRPDFALPYLLHAVDKAPLVEDLYVRLMRIYMDKGCRSDVLAVFKRAREIFESELGVELGPEISDLVKTVW